MAFVWVAQGRISWKQCANLPVRLSGGVTTVFNGKVYYGGGLTDGDDEYLVYCYDSSQDKWTTLPPLPVRWFGLGQVNGKLVAVGGMKKGTENKSIDVNTFGLRSHKWK